ncbi:MAG: phosphodiesterase, partial [Anaerolineales bacterium]
RTTAWGDGGYYGRVFINVRGREPEGQVLLSNYEAFRNELSYKLASIPDPDGQALGTRVFKPQEIYEEVKGVAPDLMVYFGDLLWRSVGSLGHGSIYTFENDTGPDDCNHAGNGLMITYDPRGAEASLAIRRANLQDVAGTVLGLYGIGLEASIEQLIISEGAAVGQ